MRPSPILCKRLKTRISFTTKQVGKGFYRGNRTGALGAHTEYGGYLIDWRKVRHFAVPQNLKDCKLTPFVSNEINPREDPATDPNGKTIDPKKIDSIQWLKNWKQENIEEYQYVSSSQRQ